MNKNIYFVYTLIDLYYNIIALIYQSYNSMSDNINIGQICVSNPKKSNKCSYLYLAEPEKKFLEKFGRLGILINLNLKHNIGNEVLSQAEGWTQSLTDFIKADFYSSTRPTDDAEGEFENLLQKINNWLQQQKIKRSDLFKKDVSSLDINVIAILDKNVYFSQIGGIKTYLIPVSPKDKSNKAGQELTEDLSFPSETNGEIFPNVISGTLEDDGVLLFATKNLFDYFPLKKISQMLKELPVKRAVSEIKQLLPDEINRINLLTLIISNRDESSLFSPDKPIQPVLKKPSKTGIHSAAEKIKTSQEAEPPIKKTFLKIPCRETKPKINKQKTLLIILIIFALLFIQSIVFLSKQELKARQDKKYTQLVEDLKNKESELSIALIYPDSDKSEKLLAEIKRLLNELPQKTQEQKENYQLFYNRYIQQMNKLYHLFVLDNPELLIDLKQIDENIETGGLTNIGDNFYVFNPGNNYIYFLNIQTRETKMVNRTSVNVGRLRQLAILDDDNLIGYDQNQGLATFNTIDNKLIPLKINRSHSTTGIEDLFVYGRYVYLLEPTNNQIYKYSKTIDGFGKEEAWIQDGTNIVGALSLTIDGSVYILKGNGQILKFYKNKQVEEFTPDSIQPALSIQDPNIVNGREKTKIFTDPDKTYLYLLDGQTKRLIILTKQGKLVKQITSPQFEDLKDFIISKNETRAWLLAGTKIFEIQIE